MKSKLINIIADVIILLPILVILIVGCHYEATYVTKGTVNNIEGNVVSFEIRDNIFECTTKETNPSLKIGEEKWVKLTTEATEETVEDDHFIKFGDHCFLCFVW